MAGSPLSEMQCINVKTAADLLAVKPKYLWDLIRTGDGPPHIPYGRGTKRPHIRIRLVDFQQWMTHRTKGTP